MMKHVMTAIAVVSCLAIQGCSSFQPQIDKRWAGYTAVGSASFYANKHEGKKTASGERYDHDAKTAAHRQLPFGARLKVTNLGNGKSVVVKVNDRGPSSKGRLVDLSKSAFSSIGKVSDGVIRVRIELVE